MQAIAFKDVPVQAMTRADIVGEQYNRHLLDSEATATPAMAGDRIRLIRAVRGRLRNVGRYLHPLCMTRRARGVFHGHGDAADDPTHSDGTVSPCGGDPYSVVSDDHEK